MNKLYWTSFRGIYLPGFVVCLAANEADAREMLKAKVEAEGFQWSEDAKVRSVVRGEAAVIWDGDY